MERTGSGHGRERKGGVSGRSGATKPYQTPAEKFFEVLRDLGYEAPNNQRAEHFDYLFHDEGTAAFARAFIKQAKVDNVISPCEQERNDTLKERGGLLYGRDLEKAVEAKKALDHKQVDQLREDKLKTEEMERAISQKTKQLEELRMHHEALKSIIPKQQYMLESQKKFRAQQQKEIDQLDIAIQVGLKRLNDKMQILEKVKQGVFDELLHEQGNGDSRFMINWNWEEVLENEECLHKLIKSALEKYLPRLVKQTPNENISESEDGKDGSAIFDEYCEDLDRLQHCIVYEKARRFELQHELVKEQCFISNLQPCLDKAKRIFANEMTDANVLESELEERIKSSEAVVSEEYQKTLDALRKVTLNQITAKFRRLAELKDSSDKHREVFLSEIYLLLESQKIRIDVLRELMAMQSNMVADLEPSFRSTARRIKALNSVSEKSLSENPDAHCNTTRQEIYTNKMANIREELQTVNLKINRLKQFLSTIPSDDISPICSEIQRIKSKIQKNQELLSTVVKPVVESKFKEINELSEKMDAVLNELET